MIPGHTPHPPKGRRHFHAKCAKDAKAPARRENERKPFAKLSFGRHRAGHLFATTVT